MHAYVQSFRTNVNSVSASWISKLWQMERHHADLTDAAGSTSFVRAHATQQPGYPAGPCCSRALLTSFQCYSQHHKGWVSEDTKKQALCALLSG